VSSCYVDEINKEMAVMSTFLLLRYEVCSFAEFQKNGMWSELKVRLVQVYQLIIVSSGW